MKAGGGTTIGTSRTPAKLARAGEYGLDYGALLDDDWPAVAKRVSGGRGADLVLDFIGPATFERNVAALRHRGRIVQIGTLGGAKGEVSFGAFMGKRVHLIGTVLRSRALHEKVAIARRFEAEIVPTFRAMSKAAVVSDRIAYFHLTTSARRNAAWRATPTSGRFWSRSHRGVHPFVIQSEAHRLRSSCHAQLELAAVRFEGRSARFSGNSELWRAVDPAVVMVTQTGYRLFVVDASRANIVDLDLSWYSDGDYDLQYLLTD